MWLKIKYTEGKTIKYIEGKTCKILKFKYMRRNGKFLSQLLLKLAASVTKAICKCLMSKNVYILSNGVGGRRDVCKCLHSHKTIFLPQSF